MSARDMFYPEGKEFSNAEERVFAREELVYNVTEDFLVMLEELGISKKELARRLGKSKSTVTQVLSGSRNMTLGSLSDICFALDVKPEIIIKSSIKDEWKDVVIENKTDKLIKNSENVIDCRTHKEWESQQEQAA